LKDEGRGRLLVPELRRISPCPVRASNHRVSIFTFEFEFEFVGRPRVGAWSLSRIRHGVPHVPIHYNLPLPPTSKDLSSSPRLHPGEQSQMTYSDLFFVGPKFFGRKAPLSDNTFMRSQDP
jgi:hypothetical protein